MMMVMVCESGIHYMKAVFLGFIFISAYLINDGHLFTIGNLVRFGIQVIGRRTQTFDIVN